MNFGDVLGFFAITFLIAFCIVLIGLWFWFIWIVAGFFMSYFALTAYGWMMQFFIWVVIMAILGFLGKRCK